MIELQNQGCHNINFVTPEHVVPQIIEAMPVAVELGLKIPIIYNTSAYDSLESLSLLDGIVDIYMPDFKFWDPQLAKRYLKAKDYPTVACRVIQEMHRQVGDLTFDENGLALRGILVRHLVMPGCLSDSNRIFNFLAGEISPHTYINIMDQYHPAGEVNSEKYSEINRRLTQDEYYKAVVLAESNGLSRFDNRRSFFINENNKFQ
jgi:putative pyruvate formate lyase activating enzyme